MIWQHGFGYADTLHVFKLIESYQKVSILVPVHMCLHIITGDQSIDWLIDCFGFYAVWAIFMPCNGGRPKNVQNEVIYNKYIYIHKSLSN